MFAFITVIENREHDQDGESVIKVSRISNPDRERNNKAHPDNNNPTLPPPVNASC